MAQTFAKIESNDALVGENDTIDWIVADYPSSLQALAAKRLVTASIGTRCTMSVDDIGGS